MNHPVSVVHPSSLSLACDCHVHVLDPARFPYAVERSYTPGAATVDELGAFHRELGIQRVVVVQPSCYGTDNRAVIDAISVVGLSRARGVAVLDFNAVGAAELKELHEQGIRGVRLNFATQQAQGLDAMRAVILQARDAIAPLGWHLDLHCPAPVLAALEPVLSDLRCPLVLDHFASLRPAAWSSDLPAWTSLQRLLAADHTYVKLSAPYRLAQPDESAALHQLACALIESAPSRLLWGSDWPHTGGSGVRTTGLDQIEPFRRVDVARELSRLLEWSGSNATQKLILADNPVRLYGFDDPHEGFRTDAGLRVSLPAGDGK